MDRKAVEKCKSRLRIAKEAINDMAATRNYTNFCDRWYIFLTAAKNIYTILETGAKITPQSRQWFGGKDRIRRDDPLLQYIYEARNDEEHGLGSSVQHEPERHHVGFGSPGFSSDILVNGPGLVNVRIMNAKGPALTYEGGPPPSGLRVTALDKKPVLNRMTPSTTILIPVTARGNRIVTPPTTHLGKSLDDTSPIAVAKIAISYLSDLVSEAERRA